MKKDNKELNLTRYGAIYWHCRMWNWISDRYKHGSTLSPKDLKKIFLSLNRFTDVKYDCFCCEFTGCEFAGDTYCCCVCPLSWGDTISCTEYMQIMDLHQNMIKTNTFQPRLLALYAKEIADLPHSGYGISKDILKYDLWKNF